MGSFGRALEAGEEKRALGTLADGRRVHLGKSVPILHGMEGASGSGLRVSCSH